MTEIEIRPDIHSLEQQPTLSQVSEVWGTLELKLETDSTRYWVTTRGLPSQSHQAPVNYVQGYVTIEKRGANGTWDLSAVYSPEAWKLSQAFDYCRMLQRELVQLRKKLRACFSWELKEEVEAAKEEIQQVKKVILHLSRKIRQTGF